MYRRYYSGRPGCAPGSSSFSPTTGEKNKKLFLFFFSRHHSRKRWSSSCAICCWPECVKSRLIFHPRRLLEIYRVCECIQSSISAPLRLYRRVDGQTEYYGPKRRWRDLARNRVGERESIVYGFIPNKSLYLLPLLLVVNLSLSSHALLSTLSFISSNWRNPVCVASSQTLSRIISSFPFHITSPGVIMKVLVT